MKKLRYQFIALCLCISLGSFGQPLAVFKQQIQVAQNNQVEFYEVSELLTTSPTPPRLEGVPEKAQYFDYSKEIARTWFEQETKLTTYVTLRIKGTQGQPDWVLDLVEAPAAFYEYGVVTSSGERYKASKDRQRHYRGFVRGQPRRSLVSLSLFENEMMGIVAISGEGNYNIGKIKGHETHVAYLDKDLPFHPAHECAKAKGPDDPPCTSKMMTANQLLNQMRSSSTLSPCVDIYLETTRDIFGYLGSVSAVEQYVLGAFNQVSTLYANEGISTKVSELKIWNTTDPYTANNASDLLGEFQTQISTFNGDLGQLLTFNSSITGGVAAWINGLCSNDIDRRLSASRIYTTYLQVPLYSWTVNVMAHEIGHLLGACHTHACVWNGNNTAIDHCGSNWQTINNLTVEGANCYNSFTPILPAGGGTIMSYCHLNNSVGIDLAEGFHLQVANAMLNAIGQANCLNACQSCAVDLIITQGVNSGVIHNDQASNTITASNITQSGGTISYQAGSTITLVPGFHSQAGSTASLTLAPCTPPNITTQRISRQINQEITNKKLPGLQLYPNPTQSTFTIAIPQTKGAENQRIGVYNLMGTPIIDQEVASGEQVVVDLNNQPKGIYLVKYFSGNEVITKKVMYK